MCCNCVVLAMLGVGVLRGDEDLAVLKDRSRLSEDEVNVALDAAGFVVLAEAVGVEGVLVADEFTVFEDGEIAVGPEGNGLMSVDSGSVLDS